MEYRTLEVEREGPVTVVRLNRPDRMNAVIEPMYVELAGALGGALADPEVRCLVLTGSVLRRKGGDKQAFCAGADLKKHAAGDRDPASRREYIRLAHDTTRRLWESPKPVIAAVNGPARGAGTELALCCDFVLMAEDATLGLPETGLGTFVGGGITHILPRLVGLARAKELVYTGRIVDGPAAVAMGLALACHPIDSLMPEAMRLARELAGKAPLSLALAKEHLHASPGLEPAAALDRETEAILSCMDTDDWHEGLRAFAEKRPPRFKGR